MFKWAVIDAPVAAVIPAASAAAKSQITERARIGTYSNYSADNGGTVSFLLLG
jgi:hypothetical protein